MREQPPTSSRDATPRGQRSISIAALLTAAVIVPACANMITSPLHLDGGAREATFTSDALAPPAAFARAVEEPAPPVSYGAISLRALVVPLDTALEDGTMGLSIQVRARNTSGATVSLPVRGCTVWPEFHDDAARTGTPIWVPQGQCAQDPYVVELEPGAEHVFHFLAHDAKLARGLEDGRYYVVARFHAADRTLRLHAGTADVRFGLPNMAFHVQVEETGGGGLTAQVAVENRNDRRVRLEFGDCATGFELYADAERTGTPIRLNARQVCLMYLAIRPLDPGAVLRAPEFDERLTARGTSEVPHGVYHLTITLALNARTYRFPMGTVRIGG